MVDLTLNILTKYEYLLVMKPYTQHIEDGYILREFDIDVLSNELVWHRDERDREVEILEGEGWRLQMDNSLPINLKVGDIIKIPKETFHRVGKGKTKLVIKIKEE